MKYKDYETVIKYSDEDETFAGDNVDKLNTLVFDVVNVNEVTRSFHAIVDDYLNDCKAESREPNKPFSSRFLKRVKPELHRALAITAKKPGESLNGFVTEKLVQIVN